MIRSSLEEIFPKPPSDLDIYELDVNKIPVHVSCIMDGNGRWAKSKNKIRLQGHKAGAKAVKEIVKTAHLLNIKYLSLYSFSTENWARPKEEVNGLMNLFSKTIMSEMEELYENNVKVKVIGNMSLLPTKTRESFNAVIEKTKNNTGLVVVAAVNYGSRSEILRAISLFNKANLNNINKLKQGPSEEELKSYLYTHDVPDPDLLIRTSGEKRISNYLLWQIAYSEIYVTDTLWPDFDKYQFLKSIIDFQKRNRRYGGI